MNKTQKAAWCLAITEADAVEDSRAMTPEVLTVFSPVRGAGSVLVGDDLSVLFFASTIGSEER